MKIAPVQGDVINEDVEQVFTCKDPGQVFDLNEASSTISQRKWYMAGDQVELKIGENSQGETFRLKKTVAAKEVLFQPEAGPKMLFSIPESISMLDLETEGAFLYPANKAEDSGAQVASFYSVIRGMPMVVHISKGEKSGPYPHMTITYPNRPAKTYVCVLQKPWLVFWYKVKELAKQDADLLPEINEIRSKERSQHDLAFSCESEKGQHLWVNNGLDPQQEEVPHVMTYTNMNIFQNEEHYPVHAYKDFKWNENGKFEATDIKGNHKIEISAVAGANKDQSVEVRLVETEKQEGGFNGSQTVSTTYTCETRWGADDFLRHWRMEQTQQSLRLPQFTLRTPGPESSP